MTPRTTSPAGFIADQRKDGISAPQGSAQGAYTIRYPAIRVGEAQLPASDHLRASKIVIAARPLQDG
jgi:hypothetical protein